MSEFDKPEIVIDLEAPNAMPRPEDFRYMFVLFTLEHRAYSDSEARRIAAEMKADHGEDVYCVKVDFGPDDAGLSVPAWLLT